MINWIRRNKFLLLILALAFVLRFFLVLFSRSFTWDEIFSFTYSQRPWLESLKFWTWETNPPLHLFFLKLWFYVFPADEFWTRVPSLIFGLLAVFYTYKIGREFLNKKTGLIAALIVAIHPQHIFLSTFARAYSLLIFLSSASIYYFFRYFIGAEKKRRDLIILAIFNLLLIYAHLTGILLIGVETAVLLFHKSSDIKQWIKLHLLTLPLWLIWAIPSVLAKIQNSSADMGSAWFLNLNQQPINLVMSLFPLFFGPGRPYFIFLLMFIVTTLAIGYFYESFKNKKIDTNFIYLFFIFLLPLLTCFFVGTTNFKFYIIILPAFAMVVAYLLTRQLPVLIIIGALLLASLPGIKNIYTQYNPLLKDEWRFINNYLGEHHKKEKKQLVIYNIFVHKLLLDRYYTAPFKTIGYLTEKDTSDFDRLIITKNYVYYKRPDAEIDAWVEQNKINEYEEVFILQKDDYGVMLNEALERKGWKKQDDIKNYFLEVDHIFHYVR